MGTPVLILGESGSGKSSSLRNFVQGEVLVLNVANKRLPFRQKLDTEDKATHDSIGKRLKEGEYRAFVIDDSQYLFAFELFDRAKETGYGKFTDIAVRFRNMLRYIAELLPDDCIVYFLHHTETTDSGRVKAKTVGKMLDNHLTVEGLFPVVLLCQTDGKTHKFITQSDGYTTAKSPMEMLPSEMDNDLKAVDTAIREYWELAPLKKNREEK
jgi:hypothetical protein